MCVGAGFYSARLVRNYPKHGQSRALPLRPIGKISENKNNGIVQIHGYLKTDIILRMCVGAGFYSARLLQNWQNAGRAEPCPYDLLGKSQKIKITELSKFTVI